MTCWAHSLVLNCTTGSARVQRLDVYRNHWLVRKSAAAAMSHRFFQFTFGKELEVSCCFCNPYYMVDSPGSLALIRFKYEVLAVTIGGPAFPPIMDNIPLFRRGCFTDHLTPGMHNLDVSALQILSQFANPIHWSFVAREISARKPKTVARLLSSSLWAVVLDHGVTALMLAWRLVPAPIRIQAYRGLAFLGAHIYGSSCSLNVQQLPFDLYLKTSSVTFHKSLVNEYGALQLVRRHTQISVPRPLGLVSNSIYSYLLTSKTPGVRLGSCIDTLSDAEAKTLVCDLQKCVSELRALPKDVAPAYAITNALGDACYDHRIIAGSDWVDTRDGFVGPFVNEKFNEALQLGALPAVSHRGGHAIVFTR